MNQGFTSDRELWFAVYDVLVEHAAAPEEDRGMLIALMCTAARPRARLFRGLLGEGGTIWPGHPPRVTVDPKDETPERLAIVERINAALAALEGGG